MGKSLSSSWPLMALALLVVGCGGSSTHRTSESGTPSVPSTVARDAAMEFKVEWPDRTRTLSTAANSAVVTIAYKGQTVATHTFDRPSGDSSTQDAFTFTGLPAADVTVTLEAFTATGGTGTSLGTTVTTPILKSGEKASETGSLATAATKLEIVGHALPIDAGLSEGLSVTARDANGYLVPFAAGSEVVWSSSNESVATVTSDLGSATVTGVAVGTATITATYKGLRAEYTTTVAAATAKLKFSMPWTFDGVPAPAGWQTLYVKATDSAGNFVKKTIDRPLDNGTVSVDLEGLKAGDVTLSYIMAGAETRSPYYDLFEDHASVSVTKGGVNAFEFAKGSFHAQTVDVKLTSENQNASGGVWLYFNQPTLLKATAWMTDGTQEDVTADAQWTVDDETVATVESAGQVLPLPFFSSTHTPIRAKYKDITASLMGTIYID